MRLSFEAGQRENRPDFGGGKPDIFALEAGSPKIGLKLFNKTPLVRIDNEELCGGADVPGNL